MHYTVSVIRSFNGISKSNYSGFIHNQYTQLAFFPLVIFLISFFFYIHSKVTYFNFFNVFICRIVIENTCMNILKENILIFKRFLFMDLHRFPL